MFGPRLFPTLLIVLDLAASARWAFAGNWAQVLYWFFAACLTAVVTFMRMT